MQTCEKCGKKIRKVCVYIHRSGINYYYCHDCFRENVKKMLTKRAKRIMGEMRRKKSFERAMMCGVYSENGYIPEEAFKGLENK